MKRQPHFIAHILVTAIFLFNTSFASAQLQVTISQTNTDANDCARTLSANVQNGSGNYSYLWTITTPGITFPSPNNLQTVNLGINQTVDVLVTVTDNASSNTTQDDVIVYRVLQGNFDIYIPNYITPNGDGYNDEWIITDSNQGITPINAYSYVMTIRDSNNALVYSKTGTVTSNYLGLLGGDIVWNARYNGTGSIVPPGVYSYTVTLQNCTQSQNYAGQLVVVI